MLFHIIFFMILFFRPYASTFRGSFTFVTILIQFSQYCFLAIWNRELKATGLTISSDGHQIQVTDTDGDHVAIIGNRKLTHGSFTVTVQTHIPRQNRYSIGCLYDKPTSFDRGFSYKAGGPWGWGLHDHQNTAGIYCQGQKVAPSSSGYATNDLVTMMVDVDKGNLIYWVNGLKCAELLDCEMITHGVWLAATLFNKNATWKIIT